MTFNSTKWDAGIKTWKYIKPQQNMREQKVTPQRNRKIRHRKCKQLLGTVHANSLGKDTCVREVKVLFCHLWETQYNWVQIKLNNKQNKQIKKNRKKNKTKA